jgi:hypothetical protein
MGCPVIDPTSQTYAYAIPVGNIDILDVQPGGGLTTTPSQWINGVEQKFPTRVQLHKCVQCKALLLPLDTTMHLHEHNMVNAALVELQLRTDRRPPNRRRLKPGEAGGT